MARCPGAMMPCGQHTTLRVSSVCEQGPLGGDDEQDQACGSLLSGVDGLVGGKMCGLWGVDSGTGLDKNRDI